MTATHLFRRLVPAAGLALLTCLILLIPRSAGAVDAPPEVLRAVHTDVLHTTYDGSALRLNSRIGNAPDYREADPAGVVFNLEDRGSARVELPDLPEFAFLGAPGQTVWIAPESQDPELLWPGWSTESIAPGTLRDDVVDLTLVGAQGPGAVEVFFNWEGSGPVRRQFSSTDPAYRTVRQPVGRHVHANWAFTALGTYRLTFEASATTPDGQPVTSGPIVYTFVVGEYVEPPPTPTPSPSPTPSPTPSPSPTPTPTPSPSPSPSPTPSPSPSPTPTPSPSPTVTPPTTGPTTPPSCIRRVLSAGHVDVAARTVGDRLRFQIKDGTEGGAVWRDPGTLAFQVKSSADEQVPANAAYRFLGAPSATVWQIPQTQAGDLLWAGWNTESVDYGKLSGPVRWSLDAVRGPGKVAVYQFDQFGAPLISYDSSRKLPQTVSLAAPTHAHGNWAFTQRGLYRLTFSYAATTKTGTTLKDTATLAVVVGEDLAALCPGAPTPTASPSASQSPTFPPSNDPGAGPTDGGTRPTDGSGQSGGSGESGGSAGSGSGGSGNNSGSGQQLRPCVTTPGPAGAASSSGAGSGGKQPTRPGGSGSTGSQVALTTGHADYAVRIENGRLTSRVKDGTRTGSLVWREPNQVTVRLGTAAETTAPGGAFGFLGKAGAKLWQIPQTQKDGVVWLGWNTEELAANQVTGAVDWRLDRVSGPGKVSVFEFDSFGQPKVVFDSSNGLPDTTKVPLGTHAHGNWAFTAPGTYRVTFTHSATLTNGTKVTDTADLTFEVGTSAAGGAPAVGPVPAGDRQASTATATDRQVSKGGTAPAVADCKLATTGGSVGITWIVAGALLLVLGTVVLVAGRSRKARS
ncbi:TIGR03773 family transporter-associated surface protein [Kribbella italica]|uniref:Putative ABC transporter-associated repeat protein n=1 Tax=Kribbella italica TaxID=1540520 RepID=A0A7W9MVU6_9ACTN|nr:putative ABC transporter-associated repeat protein [Kribbella italica]